MSLLSKSDLLSKVTDAIIESGYTYRIISDEHPFLLNLYKGDDFEQIRVYIWNITHGGKKRAADEYRIQITGVDRIDVTPPYKPVLLGWDDRHKVFAGYNAHKYQRFGSSPSLQVKDGKLEKAHNQGFDIQEKEIDDADQVTEVVVTMRPDFFGAYIKNIETYHRITLPKSDFDLIKKASETPLSEEELIILPETRRRVVREHNQAIRNNKFSKAVSQVYGFKCAICGIQMGINDSAHILSVADGGTDEVTNGITLCPNHHRAFDRGIITISPDYEIGFDDKIIKLLRDNDMDGGLENFIKEARVGEKIFLPSKENFHPNSDYLRTRIQIKKH